MSSLISHAMPITFVGKLGPVASPRMRFAYLHSVMDTSRAGNRRWCSMRFLWKPVQSGRLQGTNGRKELGESRRSGLSVKRTLIGRREGVGRPQGPKVGLKRRPAHDAVFALSTSSAPV